MRLSIRVQCAAIAAMLVPVASVARDLVIHAGVLLDGITSKPQPQMSILVHDDKIIAVSANADQGSIRLGRLKRIEGAAGRSATAVAADETRTDAL